MGTDDLTLREKRLLPVLLGCLTECGQHLPDGSLRSSDSVIDLLYSHTLSHSFQAGVDSSSATSPSSLECVSLRFEVETSHLAPALQLLQEVLLYSDVSLERVKTTLARESLQLEHWVHDGDAVLALLVRRALFSKDCLLNCFDAVGADCALDEDSDETPRRGGTQFRRVGFAAAGADVPPAAPAAVFSDAVGRVGWKGGKIRHRDGLCRRAAAASSVPPSRLPSGRNGSKTGVGRFPSGAILSSAAPAGLRVCLRHSGHYDHRVLCGSRRRGGCVDPFDGCLGSDEGGSKRPGGTVLA